jgi:hypothetical protein
MIPTRHQHEVVGGGHGIVERGGHRSRRKVRHGEGGHAQPALGQLPVGVEHLGGHLLDRHLVAGAQCARGAVDHDVRRALHADEVRFSKDATGDPRRRSWNVAMNLYSESKGTIVQAGQGPAGLLGADADVGGEHDQCRFGRVADGRLVVGDGGSLHSTSPRARRVKSGVGAALPVMAPHLPITAALDLVPLPARQHRRRCHRVHRQGAGPVAVDHRRPAERLDVGGRLDDSLGRGEPLRPRRQHERHGRRQPGGNRRVRRRHAQQTASRRPDRWRSRRSRPPPTSPSPVSPGCSGQRGSSGRRAPSHRLGGSSRPWRSARSRP